MTKLVKKIINKRKIRNTRKRRTIYKRKNNNITKRIINRRPKKLVGGTPKGLKRALQKVYVFNPRYIKTHKMMIEFFDKHIKQLFKEKDLDKIVLSEENIVNSFSSDRDFKDEEKIDLVLGYLSAIYLKSNFYDDELPLYDEKDYNHKLIRRLLEYCIDRTHNRYAILKTINSKLYLTSENLALDLVYKKEFLDFIMYFHPDHIKLEKEMNALYVLFLDKGIILQTDNKMNIIYLYLKNLYLKSIDDIFNQDITINNIYKKNYILINLLIKGLTSEPAIYIYRMDNKKLTGHIIKSGDNYEINISDRDASNFLDNFKIYIENLKLPEEQKKPLKTIYQDPIQFKPPTIYEDPIEFRTNKHFMLGFMNIFNETTQYDNDFVKFMTIFNNMFETYSEKYNSNMSLSLDEQKKIKAFAFKNKKALLKICKNIKDNDNNDTIKLFKEYLSTLSDPTYENPNDFKSPPQEPIYVQMVSQNPEGSTMVPNNPQESPYMLMGSQGPATASSAAGGGMKKTKKMKYKKMKKTKKNKSKKMKKITKHKK